MKKYIILFITIISLSACEFLEDAAENVTSDADIAAGLKEALRVGTDTATSKLAVTDGYLKDAAVKILLPDEMEEQIATFKAFEISFLGGSYSGEQIYNAGIPELGINSLADKEADLILGVNRAAESAASEAGPIFFGAITDITITDAKNILYGSDSAATNYLREKTFSSLFSAFEPKINTAINNVKIGDKSVEEQYASFATEYNKILNVTVPVSLTELSTIGELANINTIAQPDISSFATDRGLKGLFIKIKDEEKNIREDPLARVTEILEDVFSLLDDR